MHFTFYVDNTFNSFGVFVQYTTYGDESYISHSCWSLRWRTLSIQLNSLNVV